MKPAHEIEVKLPVTNVAVLRRTLRQLRARHGRRVHELNVLFDTPDQRFRRSDRLLRLRTNNGAGVITFKGRSLSATSARASRYKIRRELEFAVSDPSVAAAVLHQLGFRSGFRYEKFRTELLVPRVKGAHIFLDETPIGVFLEIEGAPAAIDRAARTLGFKPADYVTESYGALYARYCRARGIKMGDFVFASKKSDVRRKKSEGSRGAAK